MVNRAVTYVVRALSGGWSAILRVIAPLLVNALIEQIGRGVAAAIAWCRKKLGKDKDA